MWTKSNDKNEQKKALQDPAGGLAGSGWGLAQLCQIFYEVAIKTQAVEAETLGETIE